jgi:4a-hydroxytetrahydrobiopterin dehydratase
MARLEDSEIGERLEGLSGWERDGDAIVKEYDCGDFKGSVAFVNKVLPVAEDMDHHPDVAISWATVKLTVSTHSEGGLTANDFELASRIDAGQ